MFAHVPPLYCVAASTLNRYELTMNCSVGHDVPETSDVTVIGVVVFTVPAGRICSGVTETAPLGAAAVCMLDGEVTTPRSDPHATSDSAPSVAAPNATNALVLLTTPLLGEGAGFCGRR